MSQIIEIIVTQDGNKASGRIELKEPLSESEAPQRLSLIFNTIIGRMAEEKERRKHKQLPL